MHEAEGRLESVTLAGRLVRLEPLRVTHAPGLLEAALEERDTYAYTFVPSTPEEVGDYVAEALRWQSEGHSLPFATVDIRDDRVVGSTRFANIEFWNWPAGSPHDRGADCPDCVEIGWTWLAGSAQRTGINTEAKLLQLTHAFETWRVRHVMLKTDARNTRSRQAIERIGAQFEGVLRAQMPATDGTIRDTARYTILESEWPAVKARLEELLE